MKKIIVCSLIFLVLVVFSCKKNNSSTSYTPDCTGTTPTYAATVSGLISSNCAISGCHASGSNEGPGALTTYAQIKSSVSSIRSSIVSGSMPQKSTLTTDQKNSIVCWIDAGATNN